ncbi:MAG: cytidylate kinase family protein [Candidatus Thermoplasmatota archaeon]|jgi:cytidylate kinase|nr:cytidylate kinase family protein [Candidatus Thermoplasmatota archaeon]
MRITISGHIGSGKSTVATVLSNLTGYPIYSGGYFFRAKAKELNVSLTEYNIMMEKDSAEDRKLNDSIGKFLLEHNNIIVESRLAGWIASKSGISAFKVFLDAPLEVREMRINGRSDHENALEMKKREESEDLRFLEYFGFRMDDTSIYDAVIDTTEGNADYVAGKIYRLAFPS